MRKRKRVPCASDDGNESAEPGLEKDLIGMIGVRALGWAEEEGGTIAMTEVR